MHYSQGLLDVLASGLLVDIVSFPDEDATVISLCYTMSHEQESNKLRVTSVKHKIKLVKQFVARVPGGSVKDLLFSSSCV